MKYIKTREWWEKEVAVVKTGKQYGTMNWHDKIIPESNLIW